MTWVRLPLFPLLTGVMLVSTIHAKERVDPEFLEFLAQWQTNNGEWVDPIIFFGEQETNQLVEADEGKEEWLDNTSD